MGYRADPFVEIISKSEFIVHNRIVAFESARRLRSPGRRVMSIARQFGLALMLALSVSGCAWNSGSMAPRQPLIGKTALVDVDDFVARHNANADKIQTLVAKPAVTLKTRFVGMSDFSGPTEGRLAMERPQNFKLVLETVGQRKIADIGSNDQEFWFWVPNDRERYIYWCNYSDLERTGVAVPFQPDWIVESMGLKAISSEEASQIKTKTGPEAGTSTLIFPPSRVGGETYHRTLVVNNRDLRIKEHRILAADNRTVVLEATLSDYTDYDLPETRGAVETCYLADSVRLDWKRERIAFDVKMKEVRINDFPPTQSAVIFVEPRPDGYKRRNLAELNRGSGRESRTTRSTMPAPDPRSNVRLKDPAPAPDDTGAVPRLGQSAAFAPATSSSDTETLPPLPPLENVVGAPMPSVPTTADARTAGLLRSQASGLSVER
jgi:hypothetical protein